MTRYVTTRLHPRLPIFQVSARDHHVVCTPGHRLVVAPDDARGISALLRGQARGRGAAEHRAAAGGLLVAARRAAAAGRTLAQAPFRPLGLTLYLSNQCPLRCRYCFAADSAGARRTAAEQSGLPVLTLPPVRAAARLVLEHCRAAGQRFTLVLNGGGEPTVHFSLVRQIIEETKDLAAAAGVPWWGYLATNGVVAEERVDYLARALDRIGLSCDGPPVIQDAQRPLADGQPTSAAVERTAALLRRYGRPFDVRSTVLPAQVRHLCATVRYAALTLGAQSVRITPAYHLEGDVRASAARTTGAASQFAAHFLAAQALGRQLGCPVELPDVRLHEIHGPYCNVLRSSLHLTPDGLATACFATTEVSSATHAGFAIGGPLNAPAERFALDAKRVEDLRLRALRLPPRCQECHILLHCTRECPEVCVAVRAAEDLAGVGGFRCQLQARLGAHWLLHPPPPVRPRGNPSATVESAILAELLAACPPWVAVDEIATGWEQLRSTPNHEIKHPTPDHVAAAAAAAFHPASVSLPRMAETLALLTPPNVQTVVLLPTPSPQLGEPHLDRASLADFVACHAAAQWLIDHGFRPVSSSLMMFQRSPTGAADGSDVGSGTITAAWMTLRLSRPAAG